MTIFKRLSRVEWDLSTAKVSIISSFHVGEMIQNKYMFHACMRTRHLTWKISATEAFDLSDMKLSCLLIAAIITFVVSLNHERKKEEDGKLMLTRPAMKFSGSPFALSSTPANSLNVGARKAKVWTQVDRKLFSLFYFCCYLSILLCWCERKVGEAK